SERNLQAKLRGTGRRVPFPRFVLHISADIKVKVAVAVVIAPGHSGPETLGRGKALVAKEVAAIIAKQNDLVVSSHGQIQPAIVVVIAPGRAHAANAQLGKIRDSLETPVAKISIQKGWRELRLGEIERASAAHHEQII